MSNPIQWYPGHMAKTFRLLKEQTKKIDLIIEVLDARIPTSSRNPKIEELFPEKPRLLLLNKEDLSSPKHLSKWKQSLTTPTTTVISTNSTHSTIKPTIIKALKPLTQKLPSNQKPPYHVAIIGIPNVGKSTIINRLVGKNQAKTANKPGVTQKQRWLHIDQEFRLLDTPGLLWPKFEDQEVGLKLATLGAIKDTILNQEEVAIYAITHCLAHNIQHLKKTYKLETLSNEPLEAIEQIARKRGWILKGGIIDEERAYTNILLDIRKGNIGAINLD